MRIDDNNAGAIYFIINGEIDPLHAIIFEVSKKGGCISFNTPIAKNAKKKLDEAMMEFARKNGIDVKKELV